MKCFPHPSAKLILHSTHYVSIREKFLSTNVKENWTKIQVPKFVRLISTGKKKKTTVTIFVFSMSPNVLLPGGRFLGNSNREEKKGRGSVWVFFNSKIIATHLPSEKSYF